VLLQPEDGGYRPLLTDFGIARLADAPSVTRTSQVVGTPYYLAPEVISGQQPSPAVDVYASGIMFFELMTGRPPFRGSDAMEVFQAHQTQPPPRPDGVSDPLWSVIASALAKDPARRPDANQLAIRLRAAVGSNRPDSAGRLPVHPREGTVVLPKLTDAELAPPTAAPPSRTPAAAGVAAAAPTRPVKAYSGNAAAAAGPAPAPVLPPQSRPAAKPTGYPAQPVFPGPARSPHDAMVQRPAGYAPQSQQAASYRPPQQRSAAPPQAQQRPVAPTQLRQAPRQPRPVAYDPVPKNGIGCLGRVAILLIVLALAALIGVEIGNRIAHDRGEPGILTHKLGVSIGYELGGFRGSAL
jgi:serine/threonine-protein kinase